MKVYFKLINIHENRAFPGVIYGELVELTTGHLVIGATLEYIFESIRDRNMDVVNVAFDKWGNCHIV